jgi:hypothetical protein
MIYFIVVGVVIWLLLLLVVWALCRAAGKETPDDHP